MFQPDSRCGVTLPRYDFTWVLTEKGRDQMHATADLFADSDFAPSWIYTSNFQRSFQSACVLREDFGMLFANLRTEFAGLLDPRKMGALDGKSADLLQEVWDSESRRRQTPSVRTDHRGAS
ncbi:hypothetical protein CYMTET_49561 [Cymbomonas tetramitiformis]|uniref:Uncharacterized protein n=1 Tax=Cymbomonas tetramitiformis TaxID=36881 RepID=A0AAE0EUK6_9CHLO|nr:hypothetical protein CYMTET_49561 [Cymbomonas tetramitiformis]